MCIIPLSPELGKIGVLVGLKSTADKDKLSALAKQLAMHVAAAAPLALTQAHMDKAVVEREYAIQKDLALQSGKPEAVVEEDDGRAHAQILRRDGAAAADLRD